MRAGSHLGGVDLVEVLDDVDDAVGDLTLVQARARAHEPPGGGDRDRGRGELRE